MKDMYGNNKYTQWLQDIYNAMEESEKFLPHGAWAWGNDRKTQRRHTSVRCTTFPKLQYGT